MGYTHYWSQNAEVGPLRWANFTAGAKRLFALAAERGIRLAYEYDEPNRPPEITDDAIHFNGVDDEGHETAILSREPGREFCKTARKPYDVVLVAMLCYLSSVHSDIFEARSDGNSEDWRKGLALAREAWPAVQIEAPKGLREPHPEEAEYAAELRAAEDRAKSYAQEALF